MDYSFNVCNEFGEVWISDDQQACALILFPDKKRSSFRTLLWDFKLALSVIGIDRVTAFKTGTGTPELLTWETPTGNSFSEMHIPDYSLPLFRCEPYHLFRSKVYQCSGLNLTSNSAAKFTRHSM